MPTQIGPYEIKSEIGGNERGQVFAAYDPNSNRSVAVKMLRSQSLFTLTGERKFTTQMAALKALNHPFLLPIIDYGDEDNRPYIVMPLMMGNLTQKMETGPLDVVNTLDMARGLADALDFAAANGQYHYDLKPNNILFDEHGHAFIADLGIVQVIDSLSAAKTPGVNPHYVSPEQVRKRRLTGQSHQYALAALLFHALTGQVLFQGATDLVASFKHTSERPRSIRTLRPELSPAFDAVIKRALEKQPEARFPSSRDFAAALVKANGGQITPEEVQAQVSQPRPISVQPARMPVLRPSIGANDGLQRAIRIRAVIAVVIAVSVCTCALANMLLIQVDF